MSIGLLHRRRAVLAAIAAVTLGLGAAMSAFGVDPSSFEFADGNTTHQSTTDWDDVYAAAKSGGSLTGYETVSWIQDHDYTDEQSMFTIGSKDVNDVSTWGWRVVGEVPDKTDLLNVLAAKSGTQLYFAADRYATNGDAKVGFWFLQDDVARQGTGGGTFTGNHKVGDILIESLFPRGGKIAAQYVKVWEWVGGDGPAGHLELQSALTGTDCSDAGVAGYDVCLTVNQGETTSAWGTDGAYTSKFSKGEGHSYVPGAFIEGALDLTALFGEEIPCFGSYVAETRSSGSSVTSELKDVVDGAFNTCADITVQKVRIGGSASDTFEFTKGGDFSGTFDLTGATSAGSIGAGNETTFEDLFPGTYTITETDLPEGYTLTDISCTGGDVEENGAGDGVSITVDGGDIVTCTFTNGYTPEVEVKKELTPSDDAGRFDLLIDGETLASGVGDGGTTGFQALEPGSHTVSEAAAEGTELSAYTTTISCTNGESGSGTSLLIDVDYGDRVTCTIHNSLIPTPTRTQGYWQTHWGLTNDVWNGEKGEEPMSTADRTLCTVEITAVEGNGTNQLLGGFWSTISSKVDGTKRLRLDQARMSLLQQLLAAMLNRAYFGTSESISDSIDSAKAALCTTNVGAINSAQSAMGAYNSSGDSSPMPSADSAPADPSGSQSQANKTFWDTFLAGLPH